MPPADPNTNALNGTLEIARRGLLDLGLRNTLLNYRPVRAKGVEVVDENPAVIFRIIVREEKSLTFLPGDKPEAVGSGNGAIEQLAQPGEERGSAARHTDLRLQTPHPSTQLQSRLLATYHAARTSMEEQGVFGAGHAVLARRRQQ
jgi:Protein of unknown function (DUF4011)